MTFARILSEERAKQKQLMLLSAVPVNQKHNTKKALATILLLLLFIPYPALSQSGEAATRDLETIATQIDAISSRLNNNRQQRQAEQNKLLRAEKQISNNQKSLLLLEARIRERTQAVQDSQQLIRGMRDEATLATKALAELIKDQYKQGSDSYVKQVLNQENPYALGRLNHYRSIFGDAMVATIKNRAELIERLRLQQEDHAKQLAQLESDQRSLSSKQAELLSNKSRRQRAIQAIDVELSDNSARLEKLNNDRSRLQSLLTQIEQKAKELSRLAARPTRPLVPGGFLKQQGRLSSPVEGDVVTNFGARIPTSGMRSNGIYYESKQNAIVRAIYRGTVIFSDYLKGFGQLIIVDHGDDHISLYGYNDQLLKSVGDAVEVDEVIARVGTSGGLKQPGLYFEIRQNTQPVNPNKWIVQ